MAFTIKNNLGRQQRNHWTATISFFYLSPLDSWLEHVTVRVNPNSDTEAPRVKSTAGISVHRCSALNTIYMGMRFFISAKFEIARRVPACASIIQWTSQTVELVHANLSCVSVCPSTYLPSKGDETSRLCWFCGAHPLHPLGVDGQMEGANPILQTGPLILAIVYDHSKRRRERMASYHKWSLNQYFEREQWRFDKASTSK